MNNDASLTSLIGSQARTAPDRVALMDVHGGRLDYAAVAERIRRMASGLANLGVGRGDRVALVLPNGPDAALAFLGAAARGCAAPLNPSFNREEFVFYLDDLKASVLIADEQSVPACGEAARSFGIPVVTPSQLVKAGTGSPDPGGPDADDVALVLHTSGTTSRPKIVPLSHANLVASAHTIAASLLLGPADRCLNVMPLFHIHGLVGAVLSTLAAGGSVVCTPGFDARQFLQWLGALHPTWFTAVPTMHQAIVARLRAGESVPAGSALRFARSCSSALAPQLMAEIEATLGVPVVEAYGMTEASHQMACNPLPPGVRKPGSVGVATGVEIGVMDEAGDLLETESVGEIVIRGPGVTRGYESPAGANQSAFSRGWFRTGDQGRIDGDGYVFLTGRIKEIINRGGEKVSPREIDEVLLDHPAVAQAVAFAAPHATLGEDVAAAVVLKPGMEASADELREFAFGRLADFKVPSSIVVVESIPKGPTGKLQRIGLFEKLRDRFIEAFEPPRNDIEALIADIWSEVLGIERIGLRDHFFALGGDSLRGARVIARINDLFRAELRVPALFRKPTLGQFAALVRENANPERLAELVAAFEESGESELADAARSS